MKHNFTYLASPYSRYPEGRKAAYVLACQKAAQLMLDGEKIFCPIAHSHPIENIGMDDSQSGDFWLDQDFAILAHASKLKVYRMKGWEDSVGVTREIEFAKKLGLPIEYVD